MKFGGIAAKTSFQKNTMRREKKKMKGRKKRGHESSSAAEKKNRRGRESKGKYRKVLGNHQKITNGGPINKELSQGKKRGRSLRGLGDGGRVPPGGEKTD